MACKVLRVCGIITNSIKNYYPTNNAIAVHLLKAHIPLVNHARDTSFFNKRPATQLWKSVTSVSNAGKRRGRAKGIGRKRDLNRGQIIGIGKIPIRFPGLNAPIYRGKELVEQCKLPVDPEREKRLIEIRDRGIVRKKIKLSPLERGWSGTKLGGRKIGPPDPIGEDTFDGFETWVLESKIVSTMTGNLGRKKSASVCVVTGNGNGTAGFAFGTASETKSALKTAKNRSGQRLMFIQRDREHTILHDFFTQFGKTKIFVKKVHQGYGLVCHRVINACCQAIGIKDIYAKVEGSMNTQHIIKAFFIGLLQQKSFQQLANEKQLHLVEFRKENEYYPNVVASPATLRSGDEIHGNEILDFKQYVMGGRVVLDKAKAPPFYTKQASWLQYVRKQERLRNQMDVRLRLYAEYGEIRSFLTDKYPEAKPSKWHKKRNEEEAEQ